MNEPRLRVDVFNELPAEEATLVLQRACASQAWQRVLLVGRPFGSAAEIAATSDGVITALGWSDVEEALAGLSPVPAVADSVRAEAYAQRFEVPFVIDPTGKTVEQIEAALAERMTHETDEEQQVVRRELAALVRLRLATTFA
jgi:hypothetical protein